MAQPWPMRAFFNRLTTTWNLTALLFGLWAWPVFLLARKTKMMSPFWGIFALFAVIAVGLLLRQNWARFAAQPVLAIMLCMKIRGMIVYRFSWMQVLYAIGIVYVMHALWKRADESLLDDVVGGDGEEPDKKKKTKAESEEDKPVISLVHLRSQARYLEASVLANALSEAWDLKIVGGGGHDEDDKESADGFVAGENPIFMVMVHKPTFAMFTVHNHDSNYFDDAENVAGKVPNLRFAQIIRDHEAWLALDLVTGDNTSLAHDEAYRLIGKAVSALADDHVLAILCPQHHFFNLWSPELEKTLCGDSPLDALREEVKAPVIGVPSDEVIAHAIAEARRRWPEFVAAFKQREPDDERFIVKAPFVGENGETEHMWLQVFGLEPEYVHGHLSNHPIHTTKLKQGSQVEVPVADVSDWVCPDAEGNPLGNFTHQAIAAASQQKLSS